jgi:hypothetical protein
MTFSRTLRGTSVLALATTASVTATAAIFFAPSDERR